MWTSLIIFAVIGLAASVPSSPWHSNQEYIYDIYARTLTALPDLRSQYAGVVSTGKILLQPREQGQIYGKLIKMDHAHFHDDLVGGLDTEIKADNLNFRESMLNNKEFILTTRNGAIRTLSVDGSMSNDDVNQLKAILSQLQFDIKGENLIASKYNQLPEESGALFKIMEPTVTGECETLYDIQPLPEYMLNRAHPHWAPRHMEMRSAIGKGKLFQAIKTLNYDNCRIRKGYHFGITGASNIRPNTNRMGDFLSKSTISKIIASGDVNDFTIHQICTTNRIAVSPALYHEQKAQVISQIHMVLSKMQDFNKILEGPQQPINVGSLVYNYNLPSDKENKIRSNLRNPLKGILRRYNDEAESEEYKNSRIRRSVQSEGSINHLKKDASQSDELEEDEQYFQSRSGMQESPEIPLHPFTVGYKGRHIKYDSKIDLEREARRLAKEIGDDLQNPDEIPNRDTLEKFMILIQIVKSMSLNEIDIVVQRMKIVGTRKTENLSKILSSKIFRDALSQAGTPPAVKILSKMIIEKKITSNEASNSITAMIKSIEVPTVEIVMTLFELIKNEEVQKQKTFYPNALIAFTDLIRNAEVDKKTANSYYPVQAFGSFSKDLKQLTINKFIPYFAQHLHKSVEKKDAKNILLYVRTLGNIGHPDIVGVFEKYIENHQNFTPFQRTATILALEKLTITYPKIAKRILYKVYANIALNPETRTAAVHLLMRTNPSKVMLQRMAQYTHEDPSEAVQAVVKSAIESISELKYEKYRELTKNAKLVKKFLNPRDYGRQYSKIYLKNYISNNLRIIYDQQLTHIIGRGHSYPQSILYRLIQNYGGYYERYSEIDAMISNVEDLINLIPGGKYTNEQERMDNDQQQKGHSQQWSTQNVEEIFNLKSENENILEGQIIFNLLGHKRFMTFDENTLKEVPKLLNSIGDTLRKGLNLTENILYNRKYITIAFPLATGYPFVYNLIVPTLIQTIGKVQIQTSPDVVQSPSWTTLDQIESVNVTSQVRLVYSSEVISKTGFIVPFECHEYVAGHVSKIQTHIPVKLNINIDIKNRQIAGQFGSIADKRSFNVFHASAIPFTVRKDIFEIVPVTQSKDIKSIKTHPTEKYERIIGEKTIGMSFKTEITHQIPAEIQIDIENALHRQGILSMKTLPFSYYSTMRKIWKRQAFSSISLMPFTFEPSSYAPSEKQIALTLGILPFAKELTINELITIQGIFSLISLPFADIDTLQGTVNHVGTPSLTEQWPLNTLDGYKIQIRYDAERSKNHLINFTLNFEHAYNLDKDTPIKNGKLWPNYVDEQKLAVAKNSNPNSFERRRQFLENASSGVRQASSIAFDASLRFDGENPIEFVATVAHATSPVGENERILVYLSSKILKLKSKSKEICFSYVGRYPKNHILNFEDALKINLMGNAEIQVAFGENCISNSSQIKVAATFEQTPEYKNHLRQSPAGKLCSIEMNSGNYQMTGCQEANYRSKIFDSIQISAEVLNSTDEFKNITQRSLNVLRYIGFWNFEENINEIGESDKFVANIKLSQNLKYLNANIKTENLMLNVRNIKILPSIRTFVEPYPQINNQGDQKASDISEIHRNGQICVIDQNKILTFDEYIVSEKLGKCWHSIVQYLSQKNHLINEIRNFVQDQPISILARESSIENGRKEIIIAVKQQGGPDHVIHLKTKSSQIYVTINGKEQKISKDSSVDVYDNTEISKRHQKAAIRLYQLPGQEAKIDIRDQKMQIVFDGVRIKVQAEPSYRGKLRGICGNYNGEQVDDLATPKNCVLRSEKLFVASWALNEHGACAPEVKELRYKAEQTPCAPIAYTQANMISRWEAGRQIPFGARHGKWSSEAASVSASASSSSSSSASSSEEGAGEGHSRKLAACRLQTQTQFVQIGTWTCFTLQELNACPRDCAAVAKQQLKAEVHCRASADARTQLFVQQVRRGLRPDLGPRVDRTLTFNVPQRCVAAL